MEEEVLYNLTEVYKKAGRSGTSFSQWKSRVLMPYARCNNYNVYTIIGGNDLTITGTFTTSKECYALAYNWANGEKLVSFRRAELQFEKDILQNLFSGYKILPQFQCCNNKYRVDWYIPELGLAIEFDEPGHDWYLKNDNLRQKEIETELKCKFLRYTYRYEN